MVPPTPYGPSTNSARLSAIVLATGVLERDGRILLVASKYPNHARPLWHLPGGRPEGRELLSDALRREFREETSLDVEPGELLYLSESYDRQQPYLNATFRVEGSGEPAISPRDAHVVAIEWVSREALRERIAVGVILEPLLAALAGNNPRYFGYAEAGISIEFAD